LSAKSSISSNIAKTIATSLGFGFAPVAPGTFGAFFGSLSYIAMVKFTSWPIDYVLIALTVLFTLLGTWACSQLEEEWGHDPGRVVIDETIGIYITYLLMPFSWTNVILGFVLFRAFDIIKPLGVKTIDTKLHSPFSVMLDDILAGIYAFLTLQAILYFF
jgi:phosphatidylglycerophosphatase A